MNMQVNGKRLRDDLERLATFGRQADGSISRPAFSPEDVAARRWFADRAREAGLPVRIDGLFNVLLGDESPSPAVWTGSHLDTVPEGGMFDGALGSMAALECLRRLHEEGVELARPVRGVAFSDEEGAYLGLFGSKALAQGVDALDVEGHRGADGRTLSDAIRGAGGDPSAAGSSPLPSGSVHRFVELHIEQGPTLEATDTQIGVVNSIVGIRRGQVRFDGRPDHAGTTPMHLRRDAMRGAAALLDVVPELPARIGRPEAVITCGRLTVLPGAHNVVPTTAVVHLDYRDRSIEGIEALEEALIRAGHACGARHGLSVSCSGETITPPTDVDPGVADTIERESRRLGLSTRALPSGASHDTQNMAALAPTGMIFVPSRDGRSHSRLEDTAWEDIVNGADVLLNTLLELAG